MRAAAYPYTRAIDRSSHASYRSILVLTLLAYTRSGLSERRVPPAPIRAPEWSSRLSGQRLILFTQSPVMPELRLEVCILPNTFSRLIYPFLATVPFRFGGIETRLGVFLEQSDTLKIQLDGGNDRSLLLGV